MREALTGSVSELPPVPKRSQGRLLDPFPNLDFNRKDEAFDGHPSDEHSRGTEGRCLAEESRK